MNMAIQIENKAVNGFPHDGCKISSRIAGKIFPATKLKYSVKDFSMMVLRAAYKVTKKAAVPRNFPGRKRKNLQAHQHFHQLHFHFVGKLSRASFRNQFVIG